MDRDRIAEQVRELMTDIDDYIAELEAKGLLPFTTRRETHGH